MPSRWPCHTRWVRAARDIGIPMRRAPSRCRLNRAVRRCSPDAVENGSRVRRVAGGESGIDFNYRPASRAPTWFSIAASRRPTCLDRRWARSATVFPLLGFWKLPVLRKDAARSLASGAPHSHPAVDDDPPNDSPSSRLGRLSWPVISGGAAARTSTWARGTPSPCHGALATVHLSWSEQLLAGALGGTPG